MCFGSRGLPQEVMNPEPLPQALLLRNPNLRAAGWPGASHKLSLSALHQSLLGVAQMPTGGDEGGNFQTQWLKHTHSPSRFLGPEARLGPYRAKIKGSVGPHSFLEAQERGCSASGGLCIPLASWLLLPILKPQWSTKSPCAVSL